MSYSVNELQIRYFLPQFMVRKKNILSFPSNQTQSFFSSFFFVQQQTWTLNGKYNGDVIFYNAR